MSRQVVIDPRLAYAGTWDALPTGPEREHALTHFLRVLREANFDREEPGWVARGRDGNGTLIRHPFTRSTSALLGQNGGSVHGDLRHRR